MFFHRMHCFHGPYAASTPVVQCTVHASTQAEKTAPAPPAAWSNAVGPAALSAQANRHHRTARITRLLCTDQPRGEQARWRREASARSRRTGRLYPSGDIAHSTAVGCCLLPGGPGQVLPRGPRYPKRRQLPMSYRTVLRRAGGPFRCPCPLDLFPGVAVALHAVCCAPRQLQTPSYA